MLLGKYQKIHYCDLEKNKKAQESYNFQKASAVLADYGFFTNLLKYDWNGADFLAQHIEGDWLKVQLKGRLTVDFKYVGKDIYIMFEHKKTQTWYLYPHDLFLRFVQNTMPNKEKAKKGYSTGNPSEIEFNFK
jgi:hypothetical protein